MHVFEVKVGKDRSKPGECRFTWPTWWGEVYKKIDVRAYQAEGLDTEGAVCICDDTTWVLIAAKSDPLIQELSEVEANEKGCMWRPQVTRITDEQAVLLITAKAAMGKKLTDEDKKVLDPDDPTPGVGKSPLFDIRKIAEERGDALTV